MSDVPAGTWTLDPVHSSASFAVKHMVVATFRGHFDRFEVTLTADESGAKLVGKVDVDSLSVKDDNLLGHLKSPDFFDIEQYPEIVFESTSVIRDGNELTVQGNLTLKGQTHPVQGKGTITDPHVTLGDVEKIGVELEAVIDRTTFGLDWNAPLPKGGFALADDVKLVIEAELAKAA